MLSPHREAVWQVVKEGTWALKGLGLEFYLPLRSREALDKLFNFPNSSPFSFIKEKKER